jgi:hypothetical protein
VLDLQPCPLLGPAVLVIALIVVAALSNAYLEEMAGFPGLVLINGAVTTNRLAAVR